MKVPLNRDDAHNPDLGTRGRCVECGLPIIFEPGFMFDHWCHVGGRAVFHLPHEHYASPR